MRALVDGAAGPEHRVEVGETLTFGRTGDVVLGADDARVHRLLGCFAGLRDEWFVQNMGASLSLRVLDASGAVVAEVPPADQAPLPADGFTVAVDVDGRSYGVTGWYGPAPC